jgi:hypothetical protein
VDDVREPEPEPEPEPDSVVLSDDPNAEASDTDSLCPYEPADTESAFLYDVVVDPLARVSEAPEVNPVNVSSLRNTDVISVAGPESASVAVLGNNAERAPENDADDPALE